MLLNIKKLNKTIIDKIVINIIFVIGITAFFVIPLIEHNEIGNYAIFNAEIMGVTQSDVYESALSINNLIYGIEENTKIEFALGIPLIILLLLTIPAIKNINKDYKNEYFIMLIISILALWMTTKYFIWLIMPELLTEIQFAWRMLTFFEFAISIIGAINLYTVINLITKQNLKNWTFLISLILIILSMTKIDYNYKYEEMKASTDYSYEESILEQEKLSYMKINREYLPVVSIKNISTREEGIVIIEGKANILEENKNGLTLNAKIENIEENTILELPYIYYLGYNIEFNGNKIKYFESENGFIAIKVENEFEQAELNVKYKGTILEKISYIISFISVIIFTIYLVKEKRKQND